jgi:hypothetical protein
MPARTKIEISPALVRRISGLDDLARLFFPDNKNHQRAFIVIWVEIKYGNNQFLSSSVDLVAKYDVSQRTVEIVRAKMQKLGLIGRISHFNPSHGCRSGWVFSNRLRSCLRGLASAIRDAETPSERRVDQQKDRDSLMYV